MQSTKQTLQDPPMQMHIQKYRGPKLMRQVRSLRRTKEETHGMHVYIHNTNCRPSFLQLPIQYFFVVPSHLSLVNLLLLRLSLGS